jgi:DNA-binding CsgD family transcriptional regulator
MMDACLDVSGSPRLPGFSLIATGDSVVDDRALVNLWRLLTAGTVRIVDSFSTSDRLGIVVTSRANEPDRPIAANQLAIFERVLVATHQKPVGIDMRTSASSITNSLKSVMVRMGLNCLPSRLPLLLVVAAHAARTPASRCSARVGGQLAGDVLYRTFTLHEPSAWLSARLTAAQSRVVSLWIEGRTHDEIAKVCDISPRTATNHLAASYKKLNVSGRLHLMSRLADEYVRGGVPASRAALGHARS